MIKSVVALVCSAWLWSGSGEAAAAGGVPGLFPCICVPGVSVDASGCPGLLV